MKHFLDKKLLYPRYFYGPSKAIDTVHCKILIPKLQNLVVAKYDLRSFESYLNIWQQLIKTSPQKYTQGR